MHGMHACSVCVLSAPFNSIHSQSRKCLDVNNNSSRKYFDVLNISSEIKPIIKHQTTQSLEPCLRWTKCGAQVRHHVLSHFMQSTLHPDCEWEKFFAGHQRPLTQYTRWMNGWDWNEERKKFIANTRWREQIKRIESECRSMIEWREKKRRREIKKQRVHTSTHSHAQNETHKRNLQHMISQRTVSTVNDGF